MADRVQHVSESLAVCYVVSAMQFPRESSSWRWRGQCSLRATMGTYERERRAQDAAVASETPRRTPHALRSCSTWIGAFAVSWHVQNFFNKVANATVGRGHLCCRRRRCRDRSR